MSEHAREGYALDAFIKTASTSDTGAGVTVEVDNGVRFANVRGDNNDSSFVAGVESVLGVPLPVQPNTFESGRYAIYWLGPDEWLVRSAERENGFTDAIQRLLQLPTASGVELGDGYVRMLLAGPDMWEMLAEGCTLDFKRSVAKQGECAQTGFAKAAVLLAATSDEDCVELIVRRTFAEYLALWMQHTRRGAGIRFRSLE